LFSILDLAYYFIYLNHVPSCTSILKCLKHRQPSFMGVSHARVSTTLPQRGGASISIPEKWTSDMRARSMRNNHQILRGDQTIMRKILTGSTTNADAQSICGSCRYRVFLESNTGSSTRLEYSHKQEVM